MTGLFSTTARGNECESGSVGQGEDHDGGRHSSQIQVPKNDREDPMERHFAPPVVFDPQSTGRAILWSLR